MSAGYHKVIDHLVAFAETIFDVQAAEYLRFCPESVKSGNLLTAELRPEAVRNTKSHWKSWRTELGAEFNCEGRQLGDDDRIATYLRRRGLPRLSDVEEENLVKHFAQRLYDAMSNSIANWRGQADSAKTPGSACPAATPSGSARGRPSPKPVIEDLRKVRNAIKAFGGDLQGNLAEVGMHLDELQPQSASQSAPGVPEPPAPARKNAGSTAPEAQKPGVNRHVKKSVRRNQKYEGIDEALRKIAEARPKSHEEVFRLLDAREVAIPNRQPFKSARGWMKGFQQNRHTASAWLSQAWGRLGLPAFPRGPQK